METTVEIPTDLKKKAEQVATARGLSLDALIQEVLEWALAQPDETDPLFADDAVYPDKTPEDLSANHDRYLYGDET